MWIYHMPTARCWTSPMTEQEHGTRKRYFTVLLNGFFFLLGFINRKIAVLGSGTGKRIVLKFKNNLHKKKETRAFWDRVSWCFVLIRMTIKNFRWKRRLRPFLHPNFFMSSSSELNITPRFSKNSRLLYRPFFHLECAREDLFETKHHSLRR